MITNKYYNFAKKDLFPLCRSITGKGTRDTLIKIKKFFPNLKIYSIKSGTKVFDWTIPSEWNITDAYLLDKNKKKIINFSKNNLHVVGYSRPINKTFTKTQILKKIYSLPGKPNAIPYITSYYKKDWGFCANNKIKNFIKKKYLNSDKFKAVIKSSFKKNGVLNYGELYIPGKSKQEILISTYICHPSMANNELSGPIVSMSLMEFFKKNKKKLNKSIRFVFIPETIGALTFLSKNLVKLKKNFIAGYNLTCLGDERMYSCMLSKYGDSVSDSSLILAFKRKKIKFKIFSFLKRGSDERQYNSPGIDLPVTSFFRSKYHEYPEYHTSLDDFKIVTKKGVFGSYNVLKQAIEIIQKNTYPKAILHGEPMLGKRGLYSRLSKNNSWKKSRQLLDFLQYSDGTNSLNQISKLTKIKRGKLNSVLNTLKKFNLIST